MHDVITSDSVTAFFTALAVVIPAVAGFLVSHKVVSKGSVAKVSAYAMTAANSAEELFGNELVAGEVKRAYAMAKIQEKFGISEPEAEMYLHAAVNALRSAGIKAPRPYNGPELASAASTVSPIA